MLSRLLGYSPQELAGTQAGALELETDQTCLEELIRGERRSFEVERRYYGGDESDHESEQGPELWGHLTVSLGRDSRHQPAFLIALRAKRLSRRGAGKIWVESNVGHGSIFKVHFALS